MLLSPYTHLEEMPLAVAVVNKWKRRVSENLQQYVSLEGGGVLSEYVNYHNHISKCGILAACSMLVNTATLLISC
jgi:hypothetical protein